MRRLRMRTLVLAVALALGVPLVPLTAEAATFTVNVNDFNFNPSSLQMDPGDTVSFVRGSGTVNHNVMWHNPPEPVASCPTGTFTTACARTLHTEGEYVYYCSLHGTPTSGMRGLIVVGTPPPPPSIAITSPAAGASVQGTISVEGTASHDAQSISKVEVRTGTTWMLATLVGSGTSITWTFPLDTTQFANGERTVFARATTSGGLVAETSVKFSVANPEYVDLRVPAVSNFVSIVGTQVSISSTLQNDGNVASGAFVFRLEYEYKGQWHSIGQVSQGSIPGKTSVTRIVQWSNPGWFVGTFPVRVTADATGVVTESEETNNVGAGSAGFWVNTAGRDLRDP